MSLLQKNPSIPIFLVLLFLFTLGATVLSEAYGSGAISTSFTKVLGMTLCLCLVALAMDMVWGYCGILSLGHFAFFGLGGYMIGMWIMTASTQANVIANLSAAPIPPTAAEISEATALQIFSVVGAEDWPWMWAVSDSLVLSLVLVVLIPGLLALVFGWLAFRSRVTGVYLSILTQAMTLALSLYLFQNDTGLRGNNGLSGLQNIPGVGPFMEGDADVTQAFLSVWMLWASALALAIGYVFCAWIVSGKFGNVIRGIRDDEPRVRFLGYSVEAYKLVVFTLTAVLSGVAGALYYPQAGIINPDEIAPIASIYLAVWVAIGGRGRLYGAVIGAAIVSLLSTYFTGGRAPDVNVTLVRAEWFDWGPFGYLFTERLASGAGDIVLRIEWVDWWPVLLGLGFVLVTLFAPRGLGGLADLFVKREDRA